MIPKKSKFDSVEFVRRRTPTGLGRHYQTLPVLNKISLLVRSSDTRSNKELSQIEKDT
jgi:hypothetical protein